MLTGLQGSQLNVFLVCTFITRLPEAGVQRLHGAWIVFSTSGCLCLAEACLPAFTETVCDLLVKPEGVVPFGHSAL